MNAQVIKQQVKQDGTIVLMTQVLKEGYTAYQIVVIPVSSSITRCHLSTMQEASDEFYSVTREEF